MSHRPAAPVQVTTTSGRVQGTVIDGVHAFLGIPYGAPPVGPLRFARPQRPDRWEGIRDATAFGPAAPQLQRSTGLEGMLPSTITTGGDCLHLNVHTPDPGLSGLPVLVWIHGGGFVIGSNGGTWDQPGRLAARGMVTVSINYRLGVDGFLVLRDAPPNRGVADWVAALEWVQENIAAFGGDPSQVTIGGQSAGSAACLTLLASPRASSLFRRVLAMSGVPWNLVDATSFDVAADNATALAARLGAEPTTASLSGVDYDELFTVQDELAPVGMIGPLGDPLDTFQRVARSRAWLGPVVDDDLVPRHPLDAIAAGAGADHTVMIGSTANEVDALIGIVGGGIDAAQAQEALQTIGLDEHGARRWLAGHEDRSPGKALGAALTSICYRVPLLRVAESRSTAPGPTFVYEVAWQPSTPLGAVHAIDLPYLFDRIDEEGVAMMAGGEPPASLAEDLSGAATGLVTTGDPGWAAYDTATRAERCFDVPSTVVTDHSRLAREVLGALHDRPTVDN